MSEMLIKYLPELIIFLVIAIATLAFIAIFKPEVLKIAAAFLFGGIDKLIGIIG